MAAGLVGLDGAQHQGLLLALATRGRIVLSSRPVATRRRMERVMGGSDRRTEQGTVAGQPKTGAQFGFHGDQLVAVGP